MKTIVYVKSVKLNQLNNDEYAHFMKSVANLIQNATLEKLSLEEKDFETFQNKLEVLSDVVRQTRSSTETKKIVDLDKQRSKMLSFLFSTIKVGRNHIDANSKESSMFLYNEIKKYYGIQTLPAGQKSNAINGLLKDLNKSKNIPHINRLHLSEVLSELDKYNQEHQKLTQGRSESRVMNVLPNAKTMRGELSEMYQYFITCAFAANVVNSSTESSNFVGFLNKLIEDTMLSNKQRLSQVSSAKKLDKSKE